MSGVLHLSSSCWYGERMEDFLAAAGEAGIRRIELSGGMDRAPRTARELRPWLDEGFAFSVHNYYPPPTPEEGGHFILNIAATDRDLRGRSVAFAKRAMVLSAELGARMYSIHSGYVASMTLDPAGEHFVAAPGGTADRREALDALARSVEELLEFGAGLGAGGLALENQFPPAHGPNHSLMCDLADARWLAERFAGSLHFLLDVAHASIAANVLGFNLDEYVDGLLATGMVAGLHVSGNGPREDNHDLPDLGPTMAARLRRIRPHVRWATLETRNHPFEAVAQRFHELEALLETA
jgi:sugar phosphate isomerase/epimerase